MSEPKKDPRRIAIAIRAAILVSVMFVLGAAAWSIGAGYLASSGSAPAAASTECSTCTLHHRDMQRLRKILKDEGQSNK